MRVFVTFVLLVAGATHVSAQDDPREEAKALSAEGKYRECGLAYMKIQTSAQDLFAAAVCFEKGKLIGRVLITLAKLVQEFPKSELARQGLRWSAELRAGIADFRGAAEAYQSFANKYPKHPQAADSLENAIVLRRALGDAKQALKLTARYASLYGRGQPKGQQALMVGVDIHLERGEKRAAERALRAFIKRHGKVGEDAAVAHGRLGELLWQRSCPAASADGACIKVVRRRKRTPQCGAQGAVLVSPIKRNRRLANESRKHFEAAVKLAPNSTRTAVVGARFYLLEDDHESIAAVRIPSGLDFNPDKPKVVRASQKRFLAWLETETKKMIKLGDAYREVVTTRNALWSQAAAMRMAQISERFAAALELAPVPKVARTGKYAKEMTEAYCDTLESKAQPIRTRAISGYEFCFDRRASSVWTAACERALTRLAPLAYPKADEVHSPIDAVGDMSSIAPIETVKRSAAKP